MANVYDMFPFDNNIYVYHLTYAELLTVFNYALTVGGKALFSCEVGVDCYYDGSQVKKLSKDGVVLYENGSWKEDWADRLISSSQVDNDAVVRVLRAESAASGGLLYIDLHPYFHQ